MKTYHQYNGRRTPAAGPVTIDMFEYIILGPETRRQEAESMEQIATSVGEDIPDPATTNQEE